MRRRIAIVLLGLGTFAGFAAGFASLHHHHHHGRWDHGCCDHGGGGDERGAR